MIEIRHRKSGLLLRRVNAATLDGANLYRADLRGADLAGASLRGALLHDTDLRAADLRGADLRRADLCGTRLTGANLQGADLRQATFEQADLAHSFLREAQCQGTTLYRSCMRNSDLRGADLGRAIVVATDLCGAVYDLGTRWPPTLDPRRHGCRLQPRPGEVVPASSPDGLGNEMAPGDEEAAARAFCAETEKRVRSTDRLMAVTLGLMLLVGAAILAFVVLCAVGALWPACRPALLGGRTIGLATLAFWIALSSWMTLAIRRSRAQHQARWANLTPEERHEQSIQELVRFRREFEALRTERRRSCYSFGCSGIGGGAAASWFQPRPAPVRLSDDPELRALQEQFQRAGAVVRRVRIGTFGALVVGLAGFVILWHRGAWGLPALGQAVLAIMGLGVVAVWPLCLLAMPAGAAARGWWRARLRSRLETLTPEQCAEVLLPLRRDESLDTCDIVEPLIRDFGLQGTELTPAAAVDGGGSELSTPSDAGSGQELTPSGEAREERPEARP